MKKGVIISLVVVIALVLGFIIISVLHKSSANYPLSKNSKGQVSINEQLKGVSLSPENYSGSTFLNFFTVATNADNAISWAGDWHQLSQKASAPNIVVQLSKQYNYTPIIIINTPNISEESQFITNVSDFVKSNQIKFIGIGNEINLKSPEDFNSTIAIFNKTYDAIKKVSPNTVVFTIFQYEALNGLQGGLFGKVNDPSSTQWNLINNASKSDAIGFTTYPGLIYPSPSDIPSDYYSRISKYTNKPIIFTEVGWFNDGTALGSKWVSNQQEQADFINLFFSQTKSLNAPVKIWAFLYNQNIQEPFTTMGLLEKNQNDSVAYEAWKND